MNGPHSFLFVTVDGGGNVTPVLSVVRQLVARGHRVRVLTEPCLQAPVEEIGATFIGFREYFTRADRTVDIFKDWNAGPLKNPAFDNVVFGPARIVAQETQAALRTEPTDVVVADVLMPGALIGAEAEGVRRVSLFHMTDYMPSGDRPPGGLGLAPAQNLLGRWWIRLMSALFAKAINANLPQINTARRAVGLPPVASILELFHKADLRLIQTAAEFDFLSTSAPDNLHYTGPVLDEPDWVTPWHNPWPDTDTRPLVLVSFSSTFMNQGTVLQRIADALAELPVRGLITLGMAMAGQTITVPENVVVVASAPHTQILPQTKLVVTHGGHGTVMRALSHGVPLLCLPMGRDQMDNAARVVHHGVGLKLRSKATSAAIRRAVEMLLTDPGYASHAQEMQKAICQAANGDKAVKQLEQLAAKAHRQLVAA